MKFARLLFVLIGTLVVVCAGLVALALTPSVQRWVLLRAVRDVPGLKLEVAYVSAGLSGVVLRGVQVEQQQWVVKCDRLDAAFPLLRLAFSRRLDLARLQASGLLIDGSRQSRARTEAAAAGAPAAGAGLLGRIELPFDLSAEEVRLEGRALLPGVAGQSPVEADFSVTGGQFGAGREGLLQLHATLRNPAPDAGVESLRVQAGVRATLANPRRFGKVSLTTLVDAQGRSLPGSSQLKVGAELYRGSTAEHYEVSIRTLLNGSAEDMLSLRAELPAGSAEYAGTWDLHARTAQLQPFFLGGALPDFELKGSGRFTFSPEAAGYSLQGNLQGRVSRLDMWQPSWRTLGALRLESGFDVSQRDGLVQLSRFHFLLTGAEPLLEVRSAVPLRYDPAKKLLTPDGPAERLLVMDIRGLPLDWVRPFVPMMELSGGAITGQIELTAAGQEGAIAKLRGVVRLADLSIAREGRPLLTKASATLEATAGLERDAFTASAMALKVSSPAGDAFELSGRLVAGLMGEKPLGFAGKVEGRAVKLLSAWFPGSPVQVQGEVEATLRGDRLELRPGRLELRQDNGRPLLAAVIAQPADINLTTLALVPQDAAQPVARLSLGRLPLSLLPLGQPDTVLGGYVQQGDFELVMQGRIAVLRAVAPLRLVDVSLAESRQTMLTGLNVELLPVLEYAGSDEVKFRSGDLLVRTSGMQSLLSVKAELTRSAGQGTQASASFGLELPALASQPLFAGAQALSAGRASGEVRAVAGAQSQIEARVTLNGLVAASSGRVLPVANVSFRGLAKPDGSISLRVPLLLDSAGRRSDLDFSLALSPLSNGYSVDGRLTGQQVELEDLLGVLGVFVAAAAPDDADKPAPTTGGEPAKVAAWSRFSGQLNLDVKSVTRGQEWAMTGLTGALAIEPSLLTLRKLEASFGESSRFAAKGELRFTGGAMPYRLTGDYVLNDFDVGRLFKALESTRAPTVEGLFSVSARFAGNGETPGRAIERVQGELQLTSRQGVFRGLQRASSKVSMTSKAVELGASVLGSILGSEKAARTAEKVAGHAYFVDQLAQSIGEFNYDLLSVNLTRDELLNMNLQNISLMSPEIRLNGRGSVSYEVGKPLLEQPLSVSLNLSARGKVEQLLGKLRVLDGTKDELGYARTKDAVTIGGTLAKPDPTLFFTRLAAARLTDLLDSEN